MTVAEGLRRFRRDFNLTQKNVADAIGIYVQSYQRYESGMAPTITVLIKIADAYGVSIDYLVGRDSTPSKN